MAVFVGISGVALLIQAGLLLAIYRTQRAAQDTLIRLSPKLEALMDSSRITLDESRTRIAEIGDKTNEILDTTRKQLARVDHLLGDVTSRTRRQVEHAEMVVEDSLERVHQTVATLHKGVLRPLREIQGFAAGLQAAFRFLLRGVRPSPEQLTADEEMFI
jgi:ElaB/YqjD/DUF883 family membrane-anchored ribosome-binding protein